MGNSLEVGNLAKARALIEKNAKRTILCPRQVLTFSMLVMRPQLSKVSKPVEVSVKTMAYDTTS